MLQQNSNVFWNKPDEQIFVYCPQCGLPFDNYNQLEVHTAHYCNPNEDYDILQNHFKSVIQRLLKSNHMSLEAKKALITLKGLALVKIDWDNQKSFLQQKNAVKNTISAEQSDRLETKKSLKSTENA